MSSYVRAAHSSEKHNSRGISIPRTANLAKGSNPLILQKNISSPVKGSYTKQKAGFLNSKEIGLKQPVLRQSKYSASTKTDTSNTAKSANKAHRSPVPIVKASPLTLKNQIPFPNNNVK